MAHPSARDALRLVVAGSILVSAVAALGRRGWTTAELLAHPPGPADNRITVGYGQDRQDGRGQSRQPPSH